jgi:phosphate transport system substrate-binding protein
VLLAGLLSAPLTSRTRADPADPAGTLGPSTRPEPILTSVPLDPDLPEYTRPLKPLTGTLNSVGTTTATNLMRRWIDAFKVLQPDVEMACRGPSETGLLAFADGSAQLAAMSRPIRPAEIESVARKLGHPPLELKVAVGALAVYVEKTNPIAQRGLTLKELDAIFSNQRRRGGAPARTWGDFGLDGPWADRPIALYGWSRDRTASILFSQLVLEGADLNASVLPQPTSSSVVQAVGADPAGIGYASVFFRTRRTRVVPLTGADGRLYAPTAENCQGDRYPLARFLYIYLLPPSGKPSDALVVEFLKFALSRQGQRVASDGGNYPLSAGVAAAQLRLLGQ